jgi:hypothetical protein
MNTVTLSGSAHYIGRKVGMLSREPMRRRLIAQLGGEEAWPDLLALHADRCHAYRDLLLSFAPSWLDEAEGMAEGAGVPVEALLLINSASAELKPPAPDNCTAYMALGSASGSGANLFHKNRDNRPDTQLFFARHIEGQYRTLGGIEVGGLGLAQAVNEHGLAGANNTGSPLAQAFADVGFDDRQILRMVAERGKTCDDALRLCEEMAAAGVARGDAGRYGMIFLFADPSRGLVVEMTDRDVWHEFHDDGLVIRSNHFRLEGAVSATGPLEPNSTTLQRYARAEDLLGPRAGHLQPDDFLAAGRDTAGHPASLCNPSTVSIVTHQLSPEAGCRMSWVCNGYPLAAPTREWSHSEVATPVEYVDGTSWVSPPVRA